MASVSELIAAAQAQQPVNPMASSVQSLLAGVQQAQQQSLDRAIKLIQIDEARRKAEYQAKKRAELESMTKTNFNSVSGAKGAVLPTQKLEKEVSVNPSGEVTETYKSIDQKLPSSYEEALANEYNQGKITLDEFQRRKQAGSNAGGIKPPLGYRFTSDGTGLEAIPGGPADLKNTNANEKEKALLQGQINQADLIIKKVDQALGKVSRWSAGFGSKLSIVPTTDAKNLAADMETIKANLGFQQFQDMRRTSPTGGALGAVSEIELTALQSAVSSLDQAQSPEQLRRNLNEIKTRYQNWKTLVSQGDSGNPSPAPSPMSKPTSPTGGEVKRKTKEGKVAVFDAQTKKFIRYEE